MQIGAIKDIDRNVQRLITGVRCQPWGLPKNFNWRHDSHWRKEQDSYDYDDSCNVDDNRRWRQITLQSPP